MPIAVLGAPGSLVPVPVSAASESAVASVLPTSSAASLIAVAPDKVSAFAAPVAVKSPVASAGTASGPPAKSSDSGVVAGSRTISTGSGLACSAAVPIGSPVVSAAASAAAIAVCSSVAAAGIPCGSVASGDVDPGRAHGRCATAVPASSSTVNARDGTSTNASGQVPLLAVRPGGPIRGRRLSSAPYAEYSRPSVPRAADAASSSNAAVRSARSRPNPATIGSSGTIPGTGRSASARSAHVSESVRAALISACTRSRTCSNASSSDSGSPGAEPSTSPRRSCT